MIHFPPDDPQEAVHISLSRPALLVLGLAVMLALLLPITLVQRSRALETELEQTREQLTAASLRERDLEDSLVRQHRQLQTAEEQLKTVEHQIATIELQLDGVDYLTSQLRDSMGLQPGTGTWDPEAAVGQGGPGAMGPAVERLAQAHRRLLTGHIELQALQQRAARDRAEATGAGIEETRYSSPVNWPARGDVTSDFGWRVFRGRPNYHTGIDIGLAYGSPVQVTGDGVVVGAGWQPSYGWSVLVDHGQGYSSLYAHLSQTLAQVGQRVNLGDAIGLSGNSGNSTGPHLHYEIWKDGMVLDPRPMMDGTGQ